IADAHAQMLGARLAQPAQILLGACASEIVEHDHGPPRRDEARSQIRADETGAARDEHCAAHNCSPRRASSALAASTRSNAFWPEIHSTSSASPSASVTVGE